jgi:serine/threonine-protein kinase HipA
MRKRLIQSYTYLLTNNTAQTRIIFEYSLIPALIVVGRLLMKRREAILARQEERKPKTFHGIDYLLGVHDRYKQGALRFKLDPNGDFLDNAERLAAPPISSLKELVHAALQVENNNIDDPEYLKWLYMLMSPGSSLGGVRPKASVVDDEQHLWIDKFPSRYDDHDIAAWEYVVYQLALNSGIEMSESRIEKYNSHHHTFLTKRPRTVIAKNGVQYCRIKYG